MGERLIYFYQEKLRKEYKIAFVSTFIIAMLIHLYKFANTLPNHDSLYNYYSDQNMLGSGRWALSWACGISSYWDLPWINGLLSCIFIALTVVVIVALFKLKNPILIGLIGALLAASPATTETFFFLFTADGYMISMFLAALAVYFSRIEEKRKHRLFLSGVCACVSCGIYQAYISFALLLAACYFIDILLQNNHNKKDCFKWILRQLIIYVTSLVAYYIIWKLCMHFSGTIANNYQGISEVGKVSIGLLVDGLLNSINTTISYFLQLDLLKNGFTLYNILSVLFLIIMVVGLLISCFESKIWKRWWQLGLLLLCVIAVIPITCIWHFASFHVIYRAMMLQSLTLLFVLSAVLYERWAKPIVKNVVCLFLILIVFNNSLMANISYFYMNLCYERTYAEGVEMMTKIHAFQDEYDFNKIAVVGNRFNEVVHKSTDPETGEMQIIGKIYIFNSILEKTLLYNSDHVVSYLKTTFGLELESLDATQRNELLDTDEVQSMKCWPSGGSVTVIDDILVIKLADTKEWG